MAITINGSGTITGVSAGGLPDGSVDADTLASTLDISGKTVTLPSDVGGITTGKVLQVVEDVYSGSHTATTSTNPINNCSFFQQLLYTMQSNSFVCSRNNGDFIC